MEITEAKRNDPRWKFVEVNLTKEGEGQMPSLKGKRAFRVDSLKTWARKTRNNEGLIRVWIEGHRASSYYWPGYWEVVKE